MNNNITIKSEPYWWSTSPIPKVDNLFVNDTEVIIIGSGITAMCAAIPLLKNGRSVTVIEQNKIGSGASRRNAGYVSRAFKHSFADLMKKHGIDYAINLYKELDLSVQSVLDMIKEYDIDCDLQFLGRIIPAATDSHLFNLDKDLKLQQKYLGFDYQILNKNQLRSELATDYYQGGALIPDLGGLNPGKYHDSLFNIAVNLGLKVLDGVKALSISTDNHNKIVTTNQGKIKASEVILATNGYTDLLNPWIRRRIIPFDAHMIATETLPLGLTDKLIPNKRVIIDSSHNPLFVRQSSDGSRILFGGLTASPPLNENLKGKKLGHMLKKLLPDLNEYEIDYSWTGKCSGTFDLYPHAGCHDGIYYALGYCFVGVPMGTYLGKKIAQSIMKVPEAQSIFMNRKFTTLPFYREKPWFLSYVFKYYDYLDRSTPAIETTK